MTSSDRDSFKNRDMRLQVIKYKYMPVEVRGTASETRKPPRELHRFTVSLLNGLSAEWIG